MLGTPNAKFFRSAMPLFSVASVFIALCLCLSFRSVNEDIGGKGEWRPGGGKGWGGSEVVVLGPFVMNFGRKGLRVRGDGFVNAHPASLSSVAFTLRRNTFSSIVRRERFSSSSSSSQQADSVPISPTSSVEVA